MQLTTTTQHQLLSSEKLTLLNNTICKDLSKDEILLFSEVCTSKGLDPFSNQIYAIKRGGRLTFQTGIDGLRSIAERTGEYDGQEDPVWYDQEGNQYYVWLKDTPPAACRVGIFRKGISKPFRSIVTMKEFQSSINQLWRTMPAHLLSKCAEASAIRKAFPQVAGGLYEKDEPISTAQEEQSVSRVNNLFTSNQEQLPPEIPVTVETVVENKIKDGISSMSAFKMFVREFERVTENMTLAEKKSFMKEKFEADTFKTFQSMPEDILINFTNLLKETKVN